MKLNYEFMNSGCIGLARAKAYSVLKTQRLTYEATAGPLLVVGKGDVWGHLVWGK